MTDTPTPAAPVEPAAPAPTPAPLAPSDAKPDDTPRAQPTPVTPEATPPADAPPDTPAPPKAEGESKGEESPEGSYASYGHPAADAAVGMLRTKGVPAAESSSWFEEAANTGDPSKIKTDEIIKRLGPSDGALVIAAVRDYMAGHNTSTQATIKSIYEVAGGEGNFGLIKDWAIKREKTDPVFAKTLNVCRGMLDQGPESAALAARELVRLYNSDPSNKSLTMKMVTGDSAGISLGTYITREDYLKQYTAADKAGNTAEMLRLDNARKQSILQERKRK